MMQILSRPPETFYLRQTGDTWSNKRTELIVLDISGESVAIGEHVRSWADNAHVTYEHVKELRQFINTCFAKESS